MGKGRIAFGILLLSLVAIAIGYVVASAVLTFKDLGFQADIDFFYIAKNYFYIRDVRSDDFQLINLIMAGFGIAGLLMSIAVSGSALTKFGLTLAEDRRNVEEPVLWQAGHGFHPREDHQTQAQRQVPGREEVPARLDRCTDGAGQDDRLCHSQPTDLGRLCCGSRREGRVFRGNRAPSSREWR